MYTAFEERSTKYEQISSEGCKLWAKEEPMRPIEIPALTPEQLAALEGSCTAPRARRN